MVIICLTGALWRVGSEVTVLVRQLAQVRRQSGSGLGLAEVVSARRFELRDGRGRLRGTMEVTGGRAQRAGIWLLDPAGKRRVALSTNVDGGEVMLATAQERPAIAFRERAGDPGLAFFRRMGPGEADQVDIRQLEVLNMGVDDEEAYLRLIHKGAIGLISQRGLQLSSGGGPQVELLLKGAGPLLKLLDGKGQVRFEVPAPKK